MRLEIDGTDLGIDRLREVEFNDDHLDGRTITVGTTEETITLNSDIANKGKLAIENLDATNYVDLGYATGVYPNRIQPKDFGLIPLSPSTTTLYVKANGAPCKVFFLCTENITDVVI